MKLALCGLSALSVLRELRKRKELNITTLPRVDLAAPEVSATGKRPGRAIAQFLEGYSCVAGFSSDRPLNVAVPAAKHRLRVKGVSCTVYSGGLPKGAFIGIGGGLVVSSPELLFVELANVMSPEVHLLMGMELCGTFARDPANPRNGDVTFQVPPVTNAERLRSFVSECRHVNGVGQAKKTLEWLLDDAWSPMEAILAALAVLPAGSFGYDLWPIQLNRRVATENGASKESRVPDLVFNGTDVGMNYDGEEHFPLQGIADAAMRLALAPGDKNCEERLEHALAAAREGSVADKRRDRDLGAAGKTVFAVTKEDLYERGALDALMLQVIEAIERGGRRKLSKQRIMLENPLLAKVRQEFVWSLLPGKVGTDAGKRLRERLSPRHRPMLYTAMLGDEGFVEMGARELGFDEVYI